MAAPDPKPKTQRGSIDWARELATRRRWLETVVMARLNDRHAVDEILQEVALATVQQTASLRDADRVSAWLYRVAVRQSCLYLRKQRRETRRVNGYARFGSQAEPHPLEYDPLSWLLADERMRLVREALRSLSRRDRELLLLKYTEDWSYQDMTRHLGLPRTTLESRLHRARERLRQKLASLNVIEIKNHE